MNQRDYYKILAEEIVKMPGFEIPPNCPIGALEETVIASIRKRCQEQEMFFDEENFPRLKAIILGMIKKITWVN